MVLLTLEGINILCMAKLGMRSKTCSVSSGNIEAMMGCLSFQSVHSSCAGKVTSTYVWFRDDLFGGSSWVVDVAPFDLVWFEVLLISLAFC
jgi:hypothetical protein